MEIFKAALFIQPVHVEDHQTARRLVLTDVYQDLTKRKLDCLILVYALIERTVDTAHRTEIGVVSNLIEQQLAKTDPILAIVFGNGHTVGVAVGEHVFRNAAQLIVPQRRRNRRFVDFGKRRGVVVEEHGASVLQMQQIRIGQRGVEGGGNRLGPGVTVIVRIRDIVEIGRGTQHRHQCTVVEFDDRRFDPRIFPTRTFMWGFDLEPIGFFDIDRTPAVTVVIRQEKDGMPVTFCRQYPALNRAKRKRHTVDTEINSIADRHHLVFGGIGITAGFRNSHTQCLMFKYFLEAIRRQIATGIRTDHAGAHLFGIVQMLFPR